MTSRTHAMISFAAALLISAPVLASPVSDVISWYGEGANGPFLFEQITLHEDGSYVLFENGLGTSENPGNGTESVLVGTCAGCNDVAIGLVEPGTNEIGDLFTSLTDTTPGDPLFGDQVFTFTSLESGSIPLPGNTNIVALPESNGPVEIGSYITPGFNLTIQSDVPEPLTLSLFGAGIAGAAALRRRRKARKQA